MRCLPAWVLALAVVGTAVAGPPLGPLSPGERAEQGFDQVLGPRAFVFPADHGPHPGFRQEWWYVTGNLDATTGERFGFELTFFRVGLAPPDTFAQVTRPESSWRTREIYTAHFAVTDVPRNRIWYAQKWSRAALDLAGARADPFAVWIDDWSIRADSTAHWHLSAASGSYDLSLELEPRTPPVLNGHEGLSRKSSDPGSASYYYSLPRISVHGEIRSEGRAFTVQGLAWLDREWSSGSLGHNEAGWDWFGLQLEDGTALMFYAMRNQDGSRDPASGGTWMEADGRSRELFSREVELDVSAHWVSPRGGRYPARWRMRIPEQGLDVDIRPVVANQELGTVPSYWEGAVDVTGTRLGRPIAGRGYVELVGYRSAPPGK
jgi:predicted secreted hydrolase